MATRYRTPFLQVTGPNSEDMLKKWGSRLIGVKLIDRTSDVSDEAIFMFTDGVPYVPVPAQGTLFTVRLGWSKTDAVLVGYYTFQRTHIFGAPKRGRQIHFICRSANLIEHLKAVDSQHFGSDNGHSTMSDVFQSIFRSTGQTVEVHPDIGKLPLPGDYLLRWNQSAIDFATELAEKNGAHVKVQGDKVLVMKDYAGESVSGRTLPTIKLLYDENYEFDVELEPRFKFQEVSAQYLDTDKGQLESEKKSGTGGKDGDVLPHPFGSQEEARRAAAAMAAHWQADWGQAMFVSAGNSTAVSEAKVEPKGFRPEIDGANWLAMTVTHDVIPEVGWTTTIEAKAEPSQD